MDLKSDGITFGKGQLFNVPLKHMDVLVFSSAARPFSENVVSSEVKAQNHKSLLLGYQHFRCTRMSSQVLGQHLKAKGDICHQIVYIYSS